MSAAQDPDKTAIVRPQPAGSVSMPAGAARGRVVMAAGAAAAVVILAVTAWLLLPGGRQTPAPMPPPPAVPVQRAEPPRAALPLATETEIAAHVAERLTVFRFADNPRILVFDYPTLHEQGLALNRIAAFVEKADLPRDTVLDDVALATVIAKAGETIDSYYFGHDYAIRDMVRFFAAADRDGITLTAAEEALRQLIHDERLDDPAVPHAIITVPRADGVTVDGFTRRIILRHELSHGEFFTNPVYADFVRRAWSEILSEADRAAILRFLQAQGYDMDNHDLVVNEMQAFLVFTPDPRYAGPDVIGLPAERLAELRARFIAAMPDGWLRTLATAPLP